MIPGPGITQDNQTLPRDEWKVNPSADFDAWLADLKVWRREQLTRMGYDDAQYRRPEFGWTQRNFVQTQMMVEDRYFFDPSTGHYTVDRYLDDLEKRYGGIDSVLIWPVYPNSGIDDRNQWDLHRDLPGGVAALSRVVGDFHRRGVRVLFPTMPWDNGTRDPGVPYWVATARLMAEIGADGVNGDTFAGVPRAYRDASDATGHPFVLEPEGWSSDEGLMWNNLSWDHWKPKTFVPPVSTLKWLESRHMTHLSDRWARDRTDNLQYAFFNGLGSLSWENVWGTWNQITPRDAEALRRVAYLERTFADFLVSADWEPHTPTLQHGVFASKFPKGGAILWTIVNRNEFEVDGDQLGVPHRPGRRYYDLWHGAELEARIEGEKAVLGFALEDRGFGCILAFDDGAGPLGLDACLSRMRQGAERPLRSFSSEWRALPQRLVDIAPTRRVAAMPPGMVRIPAGEFDFRVFGIEIEGGPENGVDFQYPWETSPRRQHLHRMRVAAFYIDRYSVTNAQFKQFIDATGYHPADDHNFLRDWVDGAPREGWERKPVTWVSLEDARAYASWAGKRLPHEWEWQYAAQGSDGRLYPWGDAWDPSAVPAPNRGRELTGPADVDAHPKGAGPWGAADLVGNVWQWTDEFVDEHTRAAALRGGSYYQPQHSVWYFPQAYRLDQHEKYLLMAPSKDRAGTLGFRCVVDAE